MFETLQAETIFSFLAAEGLAAERSCVLVIVLETAGGTYQKAGAVALLNSEKVLAGMVSGGCLEAELVFQVEQLGRQRQACWYPLQYDTRTAEDSFIGTSLGCKGCLNLALVPLTLDDDLTFEKLKSFFLKSWSARSPSKGVISLSEHNALHFKLLEGSNGGGPQVKAEMRLPCFLNDSSFRELGFSQGLAVRVPKRKRICICGAGADVFPLVTQLVNLGMELVVIDHRSVYLEELQEKLEAGQSGASIGFGTPVSKTVLQIAAHDKEDLKVQLASGSRNLKFDGYIIMSHHLQWDAQYLEALDPAGFDQTYVGLLGPHHRRDEVFEKIKWPLPEKQHVMRYLKSPVGLAIGARGAAQIATAIAAELIQYFSVKEE